MAKTVKMPARIQKRTMTVVSGQPISSKWWWMGAMRKTRRWNRRKAVTCTTTDSVTSTNTPPTIGRSRWVLVVRARPASPAPMAWAPTSPMKIRAGAAFHHRKPAAADAMEMATSERSRAGPTWYTSGWRNSQKPTNTNAAKAKEEDPAASPSSPSVRFTALAAETSTTTAHTAYTAWGREMSVGRAKERWVLTWAQYTASRAKAMATTSWAMSLVRGLRPRLRWRDTLI